jgi:Domain of unknown function (DUF4129)
MGCSFPRHIVFRTLFFLLFCQIMAGGALAVSLEKYQENVKDVTSRLSRTYSFTDDAFGPAWSKQNQLDFEEKFFAELPLLLPEKETVEWKGLPVEVDNRWLHGRVEALRKLPVNSRDRDPIVADLIGRLEALGARLSELSTLSVETRDKDAEKQKLAQILNRAEYLPPEAKEKSALERWWEGFVKWLQGLFPEPKPIEPRSPISAPAIGPGIVQAVIILLALAAIAFVIWRVAPLFLDRRRAKKEKKDAGERIILGEKLAADESSFTLFQQAESMAREGNFRGAIRKGYIAMLCELGDHKIVRLARHKTNRDYVRDVSQRPELQSDVRGLTSLFENHWYGLAEASEEEWGAFRENYHYSMKKI